QQRGDRAQARDRGRERQYVEARLLDDRDAVPWPHAGGMEGGGQLLDEQRVRDVVELRAPLRVDVERTVEVDRHAPEGVGGAPREHPDADRLPPPPPRV